MSRHHYLGNLCPVAAATGFYLSEVLQIWGSFEIVEGTDELGAGLAAELLELLAHLNRCADVKVQVARSRLDGGLHLRHCILAAAAGRNQRLLAAFEEFPYLVEIHLA